MLYLYTDMLHNYAIRKTFPPIELKNIGGNANKRKHKMSIQTLPEIQIRDQENLVVISERQYKEMLDKLEWFEGEEKRLADQIEILEREQFDYYNRNNSLEG